MADILLLCLLSINIQFAFSANCLKYDTDFNGPNINNGLEQRTSTAEDCQTLCCATMGCNGFTWASGEFFGKIISQFTFIKCSKSIILNRPWLSVCLLVEIKSQWAIFKTRCSIRYLSLWRSRPSNSTYSWFMLPDFVVQFNWSISRLWTKPCIGNLSVS